MAATQKIKLSVNQNAEKYDTFNEGEKLNSEDLEELGLEHDTNHLKIEVHLYINTYICL